MWRCYTYGQGLGGFGPGGFLGGGIVGLMVNLLLVALVVWVVVRIFQSLTGRESRDRDDSLAILQRKYAAGEINDDEYNRMRDVLGV